MNQRRIINITCWFAGLLLVSVFSCTNDGYSVSNTGLKFRFVEEKEGRKPQTGDMMRLHLKYKDKDGKTLYDSGILGEAFVLELTAPTFSGGIEEGFAMMGEGDSALFMVPADSVFHKTFQQEMPPQINKGDFLYFEVRLIKVMTKGEFKNELSEDKKNRIKEEEKQIEEYLANNNIVVKPVENGIYFIVLKEGKGLKPVPGDSVEMSYSGSFLNGEVFDGTAKKGTNLKYVLGDGKRLLAWEKAVSSMQEGTVARLILSSPSAYGEQGLGPVPPNTPVVFDMELLRVIAAK